MTGFWFWSQSSLNPSHKWAWTDGVSQIFLPLPFWEDRLADLKCCSFPGLEEAMREGMERWEGLFSKIIRGEHVDVWWQLPERWLPLSDRSLPLFFFWRQMQKSFGLFWRKIRTLRIIYFPLVIWLHLFIALHAVLTTSSLGCICNALSVSLLPTGICDTWRTHECQGESKSKEKWDIWK